MKKEELKISKVQKHTNILQIPIYCMGVYRNFLVLGGGGGNEIANKLFIYRLDGPTFASNTLRNLVHEEQTGKEVANFVEFAHNLNVLAVCMGAQTAIFKLSMKEPAGKLELLDQFQSDFKPVEACSNCCCWARDNSALAVGGDDSVIRIYSVPSKDFKQPL